MQKIRGFESVKDEFKKNQEDTILPVRGSKKSAGYDFALPYSITLEPNEQKLIWTDVKAYMQDNEVLILDIRSSIGTKTNVIIPNIIPIIDADYYSNPKNDGNIGIALRNTGTEPITFEAGERIAQGIFLPFLEADNGNTEKERDGGIGSTGK